LQCIDDKSADELPGASKYLPIDFDQSYVKIWIMEKKVGKAKKNDTPACI